MYMFVYECMQLCAWHRSPAPYSIRADLLASTSFFFLLPTFFFLSPLRLLPLLSPFFLLLSTYVLLPTQLLLTLFPSSSNTQARQSRALSVPDLRNILEELSSSRIDTAEYRETLDLTGNNGMVRYSQQGESSSTVSQSLQSAMQAVALEHHQTSSSSTSASSVSAAAASHPPVVIVCGTAFIMAAARAELGINEPRDSESLSDPLSGEDKDVDSQVHHTTLWNLRIVSYLCNPSSFALPSDYNAVFVFFIWNLKSVLM